MSPKEMESFFLGFLAGDVADYQMAAFLMAVFFQGLTPRELDSLLDLMIGSGEVLDLSGIPLPKVDKHSTGGVGDKTSLVLAPVAAGLGLCVPMMSGRGLGHTAGTLDKLEAIPGFRTSLSLQEFREVLKTVGVGMIGQTDEIAPLDGRMYALRDATATVPSIPLISASILSKKLAEDLDGLVLDVKTGPGAFLPQVEEARGLARTMIGLAEARGVRTTALLTDMSAPLGRAVGNGLEAAEALMCLGGNGPQDLAELSSVLVGEMLHLGGLAESPAQGAAEAREALVRGTGLERMARLVEIQGGDPAVVENPDRIPRAPEITVVEAERPGFVEEIAPRTLGHGVVEMGGGRRRPGGEIDLRVGFVLHVGVGDRIEVGAPLGEIHAADREGLERGRTILRSAVRVAEEQDTAHRESRVLERWSSSGDSARG